MNQIPLTGRDIAPEHRPRNAAMRSDRNAPCTQARTTKERPQRHTPARRLTDNSVAEPLAPPGGIPQQP